MFPRINPTANPLPSATQSDILEILQREQDRAVSLLSSSPLLASLFVSYANKAAALDSATATPTSESDEWKTLENTIATLQEEVDRLKPENFEMAKSLEAVAASQEAFRSQVSTLKEVNATQLGDIKTLRTELFEARRRHDQLLVGSNSERETFQTRISELGVSLKEYLIVD
jgi:predicted RNase H-like nuclease (RuvC/YqgF family)